MALTMAEVARDYETDGVPSSGPHKIKKSNLRGWGAWVEGIINAFVNVDGGKIFTSKASLDASLNYAANTMAWVIGDATVANNGVYMKVGASGVGSWIRVADLPFSFIIASDAGAGTPNAIQATTSIPVSGSALVWCNVFEANTASPVTISFNGGAPLTVKTNSGNNIAAGGLVAGMIVLGIVSGSTFRLVSDQASTAVVAAAEAALAEFQKYYLGAYAADPTTDPNGNPLVAGAWYFNTTSNTSRIYNGSVFSPVPAMDPYASDAEATAAAATNRIMSPARVKKAIETVSLTIDQMANAETLAAIINRTGLTPQMRGALPSQSDHKAYVQQAFADLVTAGGGKLWLPPISGDWKLGSGVAVHSGATKLDQNVQICGVGDSTRIQYLPTTGDIFLVGDGSNPVSNVLISDIYIISTATKTAGFDFNLRKASNCKLLRIKTDGSFAFVNQEYVNAIDIDLFEGNSLVSGGAAMRVYADPSVGRCDRISVKRFTAQGRNKGINGLIIYGAVNVFNCDEMYMLGVNRGLDIDSNASGIVPFQIYLKNFEVDRAISNAVVISKGTEITFERPDIANTSGAAAEPPGNPQGGADGDVFVAAAGITNLLVHGGRIGNGRQRAMTLSCQGATITDTKFHDVSKQGAGLHPLIYCDANARRINLQRNKFYGFSRATFPLQAENAVTGSARDNDWTGTTGGAFSAYGGSGISFDNNDSF